jgi:hypothetical protein
MISSKFFNLFYFISIQKEGKDSKSNCLARVRGSEFKPQCCQYIHTINKINEEREREKRKEAARQKGSKSTKNKH